MIKKITRNLRGFVIYGGCTLNTIFWFIPLILLAIVKLLLPIRALQNVLTRWIMAIGENWVDSNAFLYSLVNSTYWDVRGAENLDPDKWYLVVVNHQTWVDIVALQTVLNRNIPFLKFFIKRELIWFPFLGIAWWAMDMPFMKRYSKSYLAEHPEKKGQDLEATRKSCEKFRHTPTTVINFLEGTRFTEEKKRKRASPYRYLLPPRAGGVALALDSMGEMFDTILDVTLVYPGEPPNFWEMVCGEFSGITMDIKKRPLESWIVSGDYEKDRAHRQRFHQWLTKVWQEKDDRIEELKSSAER